MDPSWVVNQWRVDRDHLAGTWSWTPASTRWAATGCRQFGHHGTNVSKGFQRFQVSRDSTWCLSTWYYPVRPGAYPCHGQHGTQAIVIDGQGDQMRQALNTMTNISELTDSSQTLHRLITDSMLTNSFQKKCTYLCCTQDTYGTLKGRYQVNLQQKINRNQNFSECSETEAINLKKVASFFQDAIHFHPGHLQPKTLIFTVRALVQ